MSVFCFWALFNVSKEGSGCSNIFPSYKHLLVKRAEFAEMNPFYIHVLCEALGSQQQWRCSVQQRAQIGANEHNLAQSSAIKKSVLFEEQFERQGLESEHFLINAHFSPHHALRPRILQEKLEQKKAAVWRSRLYGYKSEFSWRRDHLYLYKMSLTANTWSTYFTSWTALSPALRRIKWYMISFDSFVHQTSRAIAKYLAKWVQLRLGCEFASVLLHVYDQ